MNWIENNMGKIFLTFFIIVIIEFGVSAWRMPKEFRHSIIPKLEEAARCEERAMRLILHYNEILNMRVDLLSEIQQREIIKIVK